MAYRMSRDLREKLEELAVLGAIEQGNGHVISDELERILGGKVDEDEQIVIYPSTLNGGSQA
jgi:hypothetical protein